MLRTGNALDLFDLGNPPATISSVQDGSTLAPIPFDTPTVINAPGGPCGIGTVSADGTYTFTRTGPGICGFQFNLTNAAGTSRAILVFE